MHKQLSLRPLFKCGLAALGMAASLGAGWANAAPAQSDPLQDVPLPMQASPACPAKASMPTAAELQKLAPLARDRGLLWRVRHQGRTSWLYGTVHLSKLDWVVPGPSIVSALKGVDKLALEINVMDPVVQQELFKGLAQPDDAPELSAGLAQRLDKQRKQVCADESIRKLRPEVQLIELLALEGRKYGLEPDLGTEWALTGTAKALRKPVVGLESVQTQLNVLISDDPVRTAETVDDGLTLLESGKAGPMLTTMADLWADGKQDKLETYAQWCECANTPRERADLKRMLDDRNPGMADGIVNLLKEGDTVFAAVGALHMVGPKGLPSLLRKKGYDVQRVKFTPVKNTKNQQKPKLAQ